jgi:ATP-dependent Clp protease, protease subunit
VNGSPAHDVGATSNLEPIIYGKAGMPAHNGPRGLPTVVERTGQGEYELDPYAKLLSERIVFLVTTVDDTSANDIVAQLLCLEADDPDRDISLYINSAGGSVTAMMAIYDTMQFVSNDIRTVCLGQAGSAAAILLAAGTPGKRLMLPHARVLIQQPSMHPVQGLATDLQILAAEVLRVRTTMENILVNHTGRRPEQIHADLARDTILTSAQALAYGMVDGILGSRKHSAQPASDSTDLELLLAA